MIPRAWHWLAWTRLWATIGASAQDGRIESDRFRQGLQPQGYVSDWAGVFTPEQKSALEQRLAEARKTTGAELAVVTLPSLMGGEINDFANKLFQQWGIGEKDKDNSILLLAAIADRRVRIEPGYGFEAVLTDARCGRILDSAVIPKFKQSDYAGGLTAGAELLLDVMAGQPLPDTIARNPVPVATIVFFIFFIGIFILIVVAAVRSHRESGGGGHGGGGGGGGIRHGGFSRGGGGFGGFSGGRSGGGGASRGW